MGECHRPSQFWGPDHHVEAGILKLGQAIGGKVDRREGWVRVLIGNDDQFRREGLRICFEGRTAFEGGGMVEAEDVPLKLAPPPLAR